MVRSMVLVGWILGAAFAVLGVQAAVSPKFRDVSIESGLLPFDKIDKQRPMMNKYWGVTIADVNKDGKYDMFMSNHANNPEFYIAKQSSGFRFQDPNLYNVDLHSSCAADMDNDGYLDIVVTKGGSRGNNVKGTPNVYMGNSSPIVFSRGTGTKLGLGEIPMRGRSSSFVDVNCDGYLDLLFVNKRNLTASEAHLLYENQGNGNFVWRENSGIEGVDALWFMLIDANDDSYMDILLMKFDGMELWLGNGSFKFENGNNLLPKINTNNVRAAAEIDYDGDGDLDLMLVRGRDGGNPSDILLEKTTSGYVKVNTAVSKLPEAGNHFHVTVGDLNNDGFPDMYISRVTKFTAPRLSDYVLINNGDKTFSVASNTGTETGGTNTDGDSGMIFDYDMDGLPDVLVGSRNSEWKLYKNTTPKGSRHYVHVRVGYPRAELAVPELFRRKSLGAVVKVFCGPKVFLARVGSPGQSHSQSYMDTLHFGLGFCTKLNKIEVHYNGNVVVTRTNGLSVDRLIEVGVYFPCSPGLTGRFCNKKVRACKTTSCLANEACEVTELARDKCEMERCETGENATNLLVNGNFETMDVWKPSGSGRYTTSFAFEGTTSMRLRKEFASVGQSVFLVMKREYTLTCKVFGGPVRYKVIRNGSLIARDFGEATGNIRRSNWKLKSLTFTTGAAGRHNIVFETTAEESGYIDECTLKRSGDKCNTGCTKFYCPL